MPEFTPEIVGEKICFVQKFAQSILEAKERSYFFGATQFIKPFFLSVFFFKIKYPDTPESFFFFRVRKKRKRKSKMTNRFEMEKKREKNARERGFGIEF